MLGYGSRETEKPGQSGPGWTVRVSGFLGLSRVRVSVNGEAKLR